MHRFILIALAFLAACQYDYNVADGSEENEVSEIVDNQTDTETSEDCAYEVWTTTSSTVAMKNKIELSHIDQPESLTREDGTIGTLQIAARNPACPDLDVSAFGNVSIMGTYSPDGARWWEAFNETGVAILDSEENEVAFLDMGSSAWQIDPDENGDYRFSWSQNVGNLDIFVPSDEPQTFTLVADTSFASTGNWFQWMVAAPTVDDGEQIAEVNVVTWSTKTILE